MLSDAPLNDHQLTLGLMPLNDAAPFVVAEQLGFFRDEGLAVTLKWQPSWAALRDDLQTGVLQGAQMLALMPLTSTLGLDGRATPIISAMTLNLGGNAITLSRSLMATLAEEEHVLDSPLAIACALGEHVRRRRQRGEAPLRLASVHPFSSHRYLLRYWLAAGGIDPDSQIDMRAVAPPLMAAQLASGILDGFCVGEPWNSLASVQGMGQVVAGSHDIWRFGQEKVLGVREDWAEQHPVAHQALIRSLLKACAWLDRPDNRQQAAAWLHDEGLPEVPMSVIARGLADVDVEQSVENFQQSNAGWTIFHRYAANFPWRSHTRWYVSQMQRWGHLHGISEHDLAETLTRCVRPDLYRIAARGLGMVVPASDERSEGNHPAPWWLSGEAGQIPMPEDGFIDGAVFE
ncbi:CmpA/NrtA family ABC transporter substrate-binding protein [Cobetia sp. L2A1]|uniref:CmpA/NrtA family ABC transporter substrate-binding protein n=1 Tax=Cobetia sp. L2A1 TaxID=2686360 RepID=UPI00131D992D|nr:CmpA/NrtA family ABC transporter substrate-binding protein [Cobetia sp. L2A1]